VAKISVPSRRANGSIFVMNLVADLSVVEWINSEMYLRSGRHDITATSGLKSADPSAARAAASYAPC
jgi:hypothetical protein